MFLSSLLKFFAGVLFGFSSGMLFLWYYGLTVTVTNPFVMTLCLVSSPFIFMMGRAADRKKV